MLFDELTAVANRIERLDDCIARHGTIALAANRGEAFLIIDFDCKHTRCSMNGLSGLHPSPLAGHTSNNELGARHVATNLVVASDEKARDVLGKE